MPVALAPKGFVAPERLTRLTCSFRPGLEARAVIDATVEFAYATCGRLRIAIFGVSGRTVPPEFLDEAVGIGKDWKAALSAIEWEPGELLVIGSSSEGRRSRVFHGTNAARIIRHSPVPVLVTP